MTEKLEDYSHMWNGTEEGWVLLKSLLDPTRYNPYNTKGFMVVIESDEMNAEVCHQMIKAGCEVIDDLPKEVGKR